MKLRQIGELKLLREVRRRFSSKDSGIIIGIGDDAAVIAPQREKILVTTDMMNERVHFDMSFTSPFQLGFKLVSVNVSDIMAMGGSPKYLFLNIAIKRDAEEEVFWGIYNGISEAMNIYGLKLAGGDLCTAENDMALSATIIGAGDKIITRGGASVGDKIYLTGTAGDSACGLAILQRLSDKSRERVKRMGITAHQDTGEKLHLRRPYIQTSRSFDFETIEPLLRRHIMPVARDSAKIAKHANAMVDTSDGLFIDLCRICDESKVGAKVYVNKIPISDEMKNAAETMGLNLVHLATSGGEDYELLFTAPPEIIIDTKQPSANSKKESRKDALASYSFLPAPKITCIGEITENDKIVIDERGRESPMKAEGYQHFGSP